MAVVTTTSPLTGFQYSFRIAGETPTQQERETIAQYLIQTEGPILPGGQAPDAEDLIPTEDSQGFFSGIGSGFGSAFASIPEGIASLGEAALGYTPGETAFGQGAAEVTDTLQEGVDYLFGQPTDRVKLSAHLHPSWFRAWAPQRRHHLLALVLRRQAP